ncbi:oligoribonuclease [Kangiella koreensis]|uniref:Oligoribonuclease n=1 Tax=Kangiella koreensis (strain DSM 16069 / JCM 12317 / KCTC 12182 / SW-125) TaxID=523791 RepID=C7R8R9_KANKD|nr:oligoribonuclease [Kangiella koreensis]ACV25932.1 Exonuclease RNase T and DNA polymerase III [Kangiella koreensis DSM 16069]
MTKNDDNLIWVDLEMTGLDPETDVVIEIATIVTDKDLNILEEGPVIAIHQSDEVLDNMNEWCVVQHGKSGLTERVRQSSINEDQASDLTLEFLKKWIDEGKSPMCGNSICQDRRFMVKHMPKLEAYFHYRHIDVSTLKELARRWKPSILNGLTKGATHLALDDIRESIEECRYYREHFIDLN